ncbi:MAG: iron-containing alcohol dehydrogenase [Mailhella sp.]|nr:iron-containing alcohol dehydrogenase [Mailhella sp.]
MNIDFTYHNPTKIHFGRSALEKLSAELGGFGKNVLFVYGKSSIKRSGLYDKVMGILKACGKDVVELPGIKSNPTYKQMMEGTRLVREHGVDLILAVGGGSTIDCSKAISVSAWCEGDAWQRYWIDYEPVDNKVVPVAAILTMAGTGSEMNGGSVITHEEKMLKQGRVFPSFVNPRFSILDPELTFSVPRLQMVSGIFDTLSHLMEQYFSGDDDNTTDYVIEGVMASLISSARAALRDPQDYEARSNIMWCATLGLNTLTGLSKVQDWEVHMIEHQVGAYTDCPHGAGLAVVSLPYYRYVCRFGPDKFVRFARTVWGIDVSGMGREEAALAGIDALEAFVRELGLPVTLRELGAEEDMLPKIAASTVLLPSGYHAMTSGEVLDVLKACW